MAATTSATPAATPAAPTGPAGPPTSASIYVGDLHPEVTEGNLFEIFSTVGPVASVRVCRDSVTRRSLGYAYVNFLNPEDADRAIDTMNYEPIRGRPCRIMWSQRDPSLRRSGVGNVFIKNLPASIDNQHLYDTFSHFGNILSCKVALDKKNASRGYGFVHFDSEEAATNCIKQANGMLLQDSDANQHKVYVAHFLKRSERRSTSDWTNCYVKNLPESWDEDKVRELFGAHGEITSLVIMRNEEGKSKGFGFVNFAEHGSAAAAVEALNHMVLPETEGEKEVVVEAEVATDAAPAADDKEAASGEEGEVAAPAAADKEVAAPAATEEKEPKRLFVSRAQKKTERERELKQHFKNLQSKRQEKWEGRNLYVRNLDDACDDDRLRSEFEVFGSITSAKVMRDASGASKGFGFVCFSSAEEATKAVSDAGHNKLILGKPVYVALAQRKEVRRAQLEAQRMQQQMRPSMGARGPMGGMPYTMPMYTGMVPRGMPPQQFMYSGGMMPRGMPRGPGMGFPPSAFAMQPAYGMPQGGGRGAGGRRGRGDARGPAGRGGPMGRPAAGRAGVKYNNNARNNTGAPRGPMPGPAGMMQPAPVPALPTPAAAAGPTGLTSSQLASATPAEQKNMIGERLYPLVQQRNGTLAPKITGMLLEMDNTELLHLLESTQALDAKVAEAMKVLQDHERSVQAGSDAAVAAAH